MHMLARHGHIHNYARVSAWRTGVYDENEARNAFYDRWTRRPERAINWIRNASRLPCKSVRPYHNLVGHG